MDSPNDQPITGFALFADGKVHLYNQNIPLKAFKATLTRSGREKVTWPIVVLEEPDYDDETSISPPKTPPSP
jgi:hypothetical protein